MPKQINTNEPPSKYYKFMVQSKGYRLMYKGKQIDKWQAFVSGYTDFEEIMKGKTPVTSIVNPDSLIWQ